MAAFGPEKLLEIGEDDRRRVARELHDDIGQRLALLADDADRLRRELGLTDDPHRSRLDHLVQQARDLSEDLRRISQTLHPAILEDLGLIPAIRSLTDDFADRTGLPVTFVGSNIPSHLPLAFSTTLYRIAQEALRNVAKHAGRASVQVTLTFTPVEMILIISDSGAGFDVAHHTGLGLVSMRERAYLAGGTLQIHSRLAEGTTVQARLPLPSQPPN